ncbi:hypothetical protein [Actinoallomurus sp. NPDC050550]|uniref:hypothetical protein n=1 Tax=Actinoallomurus sp. NPDC050550 TaxID=3154937 RepID=UPI0033F81796
MGRRMTVELEVLDPRHDPEPVYWRELLAASRRRAVWEYDQLGIAAWTARSPLLLFVLHDGSAPVGAVCATLLGPRRHRGSYAPPTGGPRVGVLQVALPGTNAERGWWFADDLAPRDRRTLLTTYAGLMRRRLGRTWRGLVWRQAGAADLPSLPGRVRLVHAVHPVARLPITWPNVEGWLGSLRPGRTGDLRRQLRQITADATVLPAMGPARELVTALEVALLRRENELKYDAAPLPVPYIEGLIRQEGTLAVTYRDLTGRLLGVGLVLDHPGWPLYLTWGALPVRRGGRRHLYFDGMTRVIGWAIGAGKAGVVLGKGKPELKSDLGAELLPTYAIAAAG